MRTHLRILADVAAFRLKRLGMSNIFAALSIMIVLRLEWPEILLRLGFVFLLNLLSVLTNDCYDVKADLEDPGRDRGRTLFLAGHLREAAVTQIAVAILLLGVAIAHSPGLVAAFAVGTLTSWSYSAKLKGVPFLDIAAIAVWGPSMVLSAFPLDRAMGWTLLGQLVTFSACFHAIQVIRDHGPDAAAGVRTTAVLLGPRRSTLLLRGLMVMPALYAILIVDRWIGLALLAAPVLPISKDRATASWNGMRTVMGLSWIAMLAAIFFSRRATHGLLSSVGEDALIEAIGWLR